MEGHRTSKLGFIVLVLDGLWVRRTVNNRGWRGRASGAGLLWLLAALIACAWILGWVLRAT